jgi:hypothetical protein
MLLPGNEVPVKWEGYKPLIDINSKKDMHETYKSLGIALNFLR